VKHLLIDENLPASLARDLLAAGCVVAHMGTVPIALDELTAVLGIAPAPCETEHDFECLMLDDRE
jgi:hypothetical protein